MRTSVFLPKSNTTKRAAMSGKADARALAVDRLFGVDSKTVLVTGGARGIGLMIAAGFVANGATVYIASRDAAACETTAAQLTSLGPGKCYGLAADLGSEAGCVALAKTFAERTDKLHVLVNNSGTSWGAPMATHGEKGWDKTYALNVKGVFFLTREMLPLLDAGSTKSDPARVINIGSIAGLRPQVFPRCLESGGASLNEKARGRAGGSADVRRRINHRQRGGTRVCSESDEQTTGGIRASQGNRREPAIAKERQRE